MSLSVHCCLIPLLSIGIFVQSGSVTVDPATAKLGENATMTFTFTPSPGKAFLYVSWFKSNADGVQGDSIINNILENPQPNDRYSLNSNGYLIISDVMKADTDYYLCKLTLTDGTNVEALSTLTVYYLETPNLEPKNIYVNETERNAIFTCPFPNGVPKTIDIIWIKDGSVLDVTDTEKYPQSDTTLEISRVNEMDEGDYQCLAENAAYSGDEGKLSDTGTLSVANFSQQPVTRETSVTSKSSGGGGGDSDGGSDSDGGGEPPIAPIIGGVIGCLVLVALIVGLSYKYDKLCFSRNAKKARGGGSEKVVLNSNFSDVDINTYAQVQKPKPVKATKSEHSEQAVTQTKPPDKPQRAPSRDRANVEQLTYADLDLVKSEGKIIHTDPETKCSSVRTEKQLTYADLDLTKDVNTGSKDKIIRTQPETEYSSIMITKK